MSEDARCEYPCGMEPMGCVSCDTATGVYIPFQGCLTEVPCADCEYDVDDPEEYCKMCPVWRGKNT